MNLELYDKVCHDCMHKEGYQAYQDALWMSEGECCICKAKTGVSSFKDWKKV